jgi:hypothetical protein
MLCSFIAIYLISGDICVHGAGAALAGMDGVFVLVVFCLPCFLYSRRRGVSYLRVLKEKGELVNWNVISTVTLILTFVSFVMSVFVIVDQSRFLCPTYYLSSFVS